MIIIYYYYYESYLILNETYFQEAKFGVEETVFRTVVYVGCFNIKQLCYDDG